jgi:acetate---CoA ligase (ADP-forming)
MAMNDRALIEKLLEPRGVAVFGASDDLRKPGGRVLRNILAHGFHGDVFVINSHRELVQSLPAYPSVASLPQVPELVIIAVPMDSAIRALRECIAAGVRAFIMLTAIGPDSDEVRTELVELLHENPGVRVLGPNSLGTHSARSRLAANFMTAIDDDDYRFASSEVFIITQSGGVGAYLFSAAHTAGFPVGDFISTGTELNLTFAEVLRDIVDHYSPRLIFGYVEGTENNADFIDALNRARSHSVPVILLRAGATAEARDAIARHSGLQAWAPEAWHDLVDPTGALTFPTVEHMLDAALAVTHSKRPEGNRVSIVAASGGAGILMTDAAVQNGFNLAEWTQPEKDELASLLPAHAVVDNPIDATGALFSTLATLRGVLHRCSAHTGTDIVVLTLGNMPHVEDLLFQDIQAIAESTTKLVAVIWSGGSSDAIRRLTERGVLAFTDPVRGAQAISYMLARG